ncbi:MAG: DUF58 domain-containing protein [Treponema sp.]|nr:DUF58 domain-containing protein [Treponema sp.]
MDRHELLRKITALPLIASSLADDLLAGDFRSVFKGRGIEFDEVRHYERGDDIRSIDWNASARFGAPFVKLYREERELTLLIVLDTSASMFAGGFGREFEPERAAALPSPYEQGLLAAALIAFSAEQTGQRLGALFFDQDISRVFPPRKGRRHTMAIISGALRFQGQARGGNVRGSHLGAALAGAGRLLKRRSLVVLVSDFFCRAWEQPLGDLARRHDVIALRIRDILDGELPNLGLVPMEDPETGVRFHAPTGFPSFRSAWRRWHEERALLWENLCRRAGAAGLELSTADDVPQVLFRFFGASAHQTGFRRNRAHSLRGGRP